MGRLSLLAAPLTVNLLRPPLTGKDEGSGGGLREWLRGDIMLWVGAEVPSKVVTSGINIQNEALKNNKGSETLKNTKRFHVFFLS